MHHSDVVNGVWTIRSEHREKGHAGKIKLPQMAIDIIDAQPEIDGNLHDLRRNARSVLSKIGISRDIAKRALGHAIPGIEGVYDRHSYYEGKSDALKRLADYVA